MCVCVACVQHSPAAVAALLSNSTPASPGQATSLAAQLALLNSITHHHQLVQSFGSKVQRPPKTCLEHSTATFRPALLGCTLLLMQQRYVSNANGVKRSCCAALDKFEA
eukprot:scaffold313094_cov21-Tisochrysis_lutea.AAC.1